MAFYPGYKGRITLWTTDPAFWDLTAYKILLTSRGQEDDVSTAQADAAVIGRRFVAAQIPRIDLQFEAFWSPVNNPFDSPNPLQIGFTYRCQISFDKDLRPNVDGTLLILGCELQTGVRDMVRYTVTGVFNGSLLNQSGSNLVRFFPLK